MKQVFALFAVLIVIIIAGIISQGYLKSRNLGGLINIGSKSIGSKSPTATIDNHTFKLDIAKTQKDKEAGLSARKSLEQDSGMLFPFEKSGYYPFWMKNMKFPIDIIFIRDGRIVTVYKNVKPPKTPNEKPPIYNSKEPADTILEINAGLSEKYNIKEGKKIKIENLSPR